MLRWYLQQYLTIKRIRQIPRRRKQLFLQFKKSFAFQRTHTGAAIAVTPEI
jgi:hypothetical protein